MRPPSILTGVGAGLLSAVIFAAAREAAPLLAVLLVLIAPLPVCVSALVLGMASGVAAGAAGALGLWAAGGAYLGGVYAAAEALPILALAHLALLRRTILLTPASPPAVEWYPAGRLLIWAALMGSGVAVLSLLSLGTDFDTARTAVRQALEVFLKAQNPAGGDTLLLSGPEDVDKLSEVLLHVFPAMTAMSWMAALLFNLWLGARIALAAGQLARPWPDLAAIEFPRGTPLFLAIAVGAANFLPGYPALVAAAFSGALFLAYLLLGLAVVHYATRGWRWRPFLLAALYLAIVPLGGFLMPLLVITGLTETIVPLRRRLQSGSAPTQS